MLSITWDNKEFNKEMNNLIQYSIGYLDGVQSGKNAFLNNLGRSTVEALKDFIDSMARVDHEMLHHVYEWNQTGNPSARLFEIGYSVANGGLSINSTLTQSKIAAAGATRPFYNKASIMENGVPITIKPRKKALRFEVDGETVFTKRPVTITNPGGREVQGGFEQTMNTFFNSYFSQAFLERSGINKYLETPTLYDKYLVTGMKIGRSAGLSAGYNWMAKAGNE